MTSGHRYTLLQLVAKGTAAVTILVLSSRNPPADVGGYVLGVVIASLFAALIDFGGGRTALRLCASGCPWSVVRSVVVSRCYLAVGVFAAGTIVALGPVVPGNGRLVALALATGGVMGLNGIAESVLLGRGRGGLAGLGNVCFNAVSLVAALVVSGHESVTELMLLATFTFGAVAGSSVYCFAVLQSSSSQGSAAVDSGPNDQGHFGAALERRNALVVGLLTMPGIMYFRLDLVLLGAMATRPEVAYYGIAYRLYEVGLVLPQLLASARQPQVASTWGRPEAEPVRRGTFALITIVAMGMASAAALWLAWGLPLPIGDAFVEDTRRLLFLLAPGLVGSSMQLATSLYIFGAPSPQEAWRPLFVASAGAVLAGVTFIPVGYRLAGIAGVAVTQSLLDLVLAMIVTLVVLGRLRLPVPRICYEGCVVGGAALAGFALLRPASVVAAGLVVAAVAIFTSRWTDFRRAVATW
ncbi:MAG: hypothetical protein ACRD0N_15475 [Acidimicrobiales bacterium]